MNNLHFILNNIFTKFFKKLTKYKNDYQQYLNYIYIYIYIGIILCIVLYTFKCIHVYAQGYKLVSFNMCKCFIISIAGCLNKTGNTIGEIYGEKADIFYVIVIWLCI